MSPNLKIENDGANHALKLEYPKIRTDHGFDV